MNMIGVNILTFQVKDWFSSSVTIVRVFRRLLIFKKCNNEETFDG